MKRSVFLVSIFVFLYGCASLRYYDAGPLSPYHPESVGTFSSSGKSAIVISGTYSWTARFFGKESKESAHGFGAPRLVFERRVDSENADTEGKRKGVDVWMDSQGDIYLIDPGIYSLRRIRVIEGDSNQQLYEEGKQSIWTADGKPVYAGFSIEPGEVLYLGDLQLTRTPEGENGFTILVDVSDKYDQAMMEFPGKHAPFRTIASDITRKSLLVFEDGVW